MSDIPTAGTARTSAMPVHPLRRTLSRRVRQRIAGAAWLICPFLALLAVWYSVVAITGVPERIFPQIDQVVRRAMEMIASGELQTALAASLSRVAIGVGLAIVTGVPFGLLMGSNKIVADLFTPLLRFSVALSGIAWIPIATLWLGYGPNVCIFIIWNSVFFAIVYSTMLGVSSVDRDLKRAALCLGASNPRIYAEVLLPGALPSIVTGLRVGLGYGWRGLIAAEMLATSVGLGYSLFLAQKFYDTAEIVFIMILIGILWIAIDYLILAPIERRTVVRWGMVRRVG